MLTRARLSTIALTALVVVALATFAFAETATVTFLRVNDVYEAAVPDAITTLGGDLIGSSMMITKGAQMIELRRTQRVQTIWGYGERRVTACAASRASRSCCESS